MTDNVIVRDATGASVTMKTTEVGGVHTPHQRISGYDPISDQVKVAVQNTVLGIQTDRKVYREAFTTPLAQNWDITVANGSTAAIADGVLTLTSGTTVGGYAELLSKDTFTLPLRATFGVQNGTRVANTRQILELVSVDPITGAIDEKHSQSFDIGGAASTSATQANLETQEGGLRPLTASTQTIVSTSTYTLLELEAAAMEAGFYSRNINSATSARSSSLVRNYPLPDPNALYKLRLRSMNVASWVNITNAISGTGGLIRLTAASAHGATTGDRIWVESLRGVTNGGALVRGMFIVTVIDATTIELQSTVFGGTYVSSSGRLARSLAPASSTTVQLEFVSVQATTEISADITARRGALAAGAAMPVNIANSPANSDNVWYQESTTAQAANAVLTTTTRDIGASTGSSQRYSYFNVFAIADQAGVARVEVSVDNTTWRRATPDIAVAANTPLVLSLPVIARYFRVVYTNGATLQGFFLLTTSMTAS